MTSEKEEHNRWSELPERPVTDSGKEKANEFLAYVTGKGNVTIPSAWREYLGIVHGSYVWVSIRKAD
jgi:hypothetical protein